MVQQSSGAAEHIRINGTGTYSHLIQAKSVHIAGLGRFDKEVHTERFNSTGSCRVQGHCVAKQITTSGHGHFYAVHADRIDSAGSFRADESVNAVSFHARGAITIGHTLSGGEVHIRMQGLQAGNNSIRHIIATEKIEIGADRLSILNWLPIGKKRLSCTSLEGRFIEVDHLEADLVIGEDVRIGRNCKIGEIRYSKNLVVDPGSVIERKLQI